MQTTLSNILPVIHGAIAIAVHELANGFVLNSYTTHPDNDEFMVMDGWDDYGDDLVYQFHKDDNQLVEVDGNAVSLKAICGKLVSFDIKDLLPLEELLTLREFRRVAGTIDKSVDE